MKPSAIPILILLTSLQGCWTRPYDPKPRDSQTGKLPCVNLNAASVRELMELPGVGEVIARRIIDYRERNGRFRKPQDIIIIEGFSERKYRAIADRVCTE